MLKIKWDSTSVLDAKPEDMQHTPWTAETFDQLYWETKNRQLVELLVNRSSIKSFESVQQGEQCRWKKD